MAFWLRIQIRGAPNTELLIWFPFFYLSFFFPKAYTVPGHTLSFHKGDLFDQFD